jgi:Fe-S cluster assembly protein SufB
MNETKVEPVKEKSTMPEIDASKYSRDDYKYGFTTDIEMDTFVKGLSPDVIRRISAKKKEPPFMLDFRLKAYEKWLTMEEPNWQFVTFPTIYYKYIIYYSAPK